MAVKLLTIAEVAAKLGVSRQQILKYIASGRMPFIELGGRKFVEPRHAKKPAARPPGPKPAR